MPRTAIVYIAERCNQKCVFCLEEDGTWREFVDPSTQQVYAELGRLHERGARHITFMGGETFFRKDLPRILTRAKETGFTRIGVTTNGTVLSKKGFIDKLVAAGLDFIELSVHGHTEELATEISRAPVTFGRQAEAMHEINATGSLFTIVNVVVCHENKGHLIDVADYVLQHLPNVKVRMKIKFVSLQGWAAARGALRYDEVDFISLAKHLEQRGVPVWFYNVPLCRLGSYAHCSHELATLSADETYFDLDHRDQTGYYDSGTQLEGRVWPEASCADCSCRPVCPGLEETHRLACGSDTLSPRHDDPLPLVEHALRDRGLDVQTAARRLQVLKDQPRPSRFVRPRPDGAVRLLRQDLPEPFDLVVEMSEKGKPAYETTGRFALSYRNWADGDPMADDHIQRLMDAVVAKLRSVDASGGTLDEARAALVEAAKAASFDLDGITHVPEQRRKIQGLRVLQHAPSPVSRR